MGLATGLAIAGLAVSAAGTTKSFVDTGKQRKKIEAAEREAQKAMQKAKSRLDQNVYEGIGIQKEKFEQERENLLSSLSTIVQAGQEGEERGAQATAGRAALFGQQAQAQIRIAQGQELQRLQELAAKEDARNRDALVNINLAEVSGQQRRAADAREAEQAANMAAVGGLVNLGTQAMKLAPLYGKADPSAVMVDNEMVSRSLIDQAGRGVSPYRTANSGSIIDTQTIFTPAVFEPVMPGIYGNFTPPEVGSTSLSSQYDSVTGRLK